LNNFKDAKININVNIKNNWSNLKKLKENNQSTYDNLLLVFLDVLNRVHFQRTMKKLVNFGKILYIE
jgi:hypothetical protein